MVNEYLMQQHISPIYSPESRSQPIFIIFLLSILLWSIVNVLLLFTRSLVRPSVHLLLANHKLNMSSLPIPIQLLSRRHLRLLTYATTWTDGMRLILAEDHSRPMLLISHLPLLRPARMALQHFVPSVNHPLTFRR